MVLYVHVLASVGLYHRSYVTHTGDLHPEWMQAWIFRF